MRVLPCWLAMTGGAEKGKNMQLCGCIFVIARNGGDSGGHGEQRLAFRWDFYDRRGGQCKKVGGYVRNDKWWACVVYGCWKFIVKPWFLRGQDF